MATIIDFLEKRALVESITSEELKMRAQHPLNAYLGIDPTADSLHLGHLIGIIILVWFEQFGHTPFLLLGGATGKIGDPSGKKVERSFLSDAVIEDNVLQLQKQINRFLKCPIILNNADWLADYPFIHFLRDIGKHFRIGPMLGKESVRRRLQSKEGMSFTEFAYQLLQSYDFYYLSREKEVILQIGGSDQWGNITAGIELTRKRFGKKTYGMTFPLLTRKDGTKFGKSEQGVVWLDPKKTSPYAFYQYLLQVSDEEVIKFMKMLTFMELEAIEAFERAFQSQTFTPHAAQKKLAEEVTRFVHGEEALQKVLKVAAIASPGLYAHIDSKALSEIAEGMPHVSMQIKEVIGQTYADIAKSSGLLCSKSEGNRMVKNGGAYLNGEKITCTTFFIESKNLLEGRYLLLSAGKKKKLLIKVEKDLIENQ